MRKRVRVRAQIRAKAEVRVMGLNALGFRKEFS
jgi:hypothetical protein